MSGDVRRQIAEALGAGHAAYYDDPRMVDLKNCQVAALLPVVDRIARQRAAEELRAAAKREIFTLPGCTEVAWLLARAGALESQP